MIRFGLHLTLRGGREAMIRLVVTAVAVALGVALLLATLAAVHAVDTQNARYAWLNSVYGVCEGKYAGGPVAGYDVYECRGDDAA